MKNSDCKDYDGFYYNSKSYATCEILQKRKVKNEF